MVSVTEPKGANTPDEIATFIEELDNEIKNTAHLQQGGSIPGNLTKCADTHGNSDPADVYTFTEEDNNITEPFRCFTNTKEKSNPCNLADNYKSAKVNRNLLENKVGGEENEEDKLKPSLKLKFFSCEYCNNCFARKEFWLRHRKSSELLFLNTNFALKNDKVLFQCNLFWESIQNLNKGKGGGGIEVKTCTKMQK